MSEETFLGGLVRKRSLPVFDEAPGPDAPVLKRLNLPQGQLAQCCDSEEGMRYIAWVELLPGGTRGNHYHHRKEEWIYLIAGKAEIFLENPESKERDVMTLVPGDLAVIPTGIAHAIRTLEAGQAIEFSPAAFDLTDTVRYPVEG